MDIEDRYQEMEQFDLDGHLCTYMVDGLLYVTAPNGDYTLVVNLDQETGLYEIEDMDERLYFGGFTYLQRGVIGAAMLMSVK